MTDTFERDELSEALIAEFAAHAIINYNNLHDAAEVLFEKGYFGLSRSLAISAQEEFGKVAGALGFLSGIIPSDIFSKGIKSHIRKLLWSRLCLELAARVTSLMPSTVHAISLEHGNVLRGIASDVASLNEEAIVASKLVSDVVKLEPLINGIAKAEYEKLRQAGLYVNIIHRGGQYSIEHPGQVNESMALEQLVVIRTFKNIIESVAGTSLTTGLG